MSGVTTNPEDRSGHQENDDDWGAKADEIFTQDFRDTDNFNTDIFEKEFAEFNDYYKHEYGEDWLDSSYAEGEYEYSDALPSKGYINWILNGDSTENSRPEESNIENKDMSDRPPVLEDKADGGDAKFDYAALENFCKQLREIKSVHLGKINLDKEDIRVNPGDFYNADHLARRVNGEDAGEQVGLSDATREFVRKLNETIQLIDEQLHTTMSHYEKAEDFQKMNSQELGKLMSGTMQAIEGLGGGAYENIEPPKPQ